MAHSLDALLTCVILCACLCCCACSGECEDALPFLTRAQAQLPEDKGLAALITKTKRTINEAEKKQAKQFSKMFA